jgi:hypothetical protein
VRVWDISAGYLNRQSLLGEHRELHGIHTILSQRRRGYSHHPETRRWAVALAALAWRHALLAAEMRLRGYVDRTPLVVDAHPVRWPTAFVTEPGDQLALLRGKYVGRELGRIALPRNVQQLWAQHKYSVMARDPAIYRQIGRAVARTRARDALPRLSRDLVLLLRRTPSRGRLTNAIEHMWGYVAAAARAEEKEAIRRGTLSWLATIQTLVVRQREPFLLSSTALSELAPWCSDAS